MSSAFQRALDEANSDSQGRRLVYAPYDQLTDRCGPLAEHDPSELALLVVENAWKAARRPYHRQKIALVIANLRHFALEQARRGVAVVHRVAKGPYHTIVGEEAQRFGGALMMEAAERELRQDLAQLDEGLLEVVPHAGWITTTADFDKAMKGKKTWRMDTFYRAIRRKSGILMTDEGAFEGGQLSFDADNREPWSGDPAPAEPPRFQPDAITEEVGAMITAHFDHHPGKLDLETLPATQADAEATWEWAKRDCMERFGPYEDAMSGHSTTIFHTRVSQLLNLQRLSAKELVHDVEELDIPINSKEGFIRQVIGWREFVRHIHHATDGFRMIGEEELASAERAGDAGWERATGQAWRQGQQRQGESDGGSLANELGAKRPLPPAFWGDKPSGLHCLDTVVRSVWDEGYSHHITRLMILSNLATLLDVDPRELTDWFWVAYTDAYDWVVEPNVLGMGTYALGELMITKPYVSGAAYIDRMSDYCGSCRFQPKKTCPITPLYWAFLERHHDTLDGNARIAMPLRSLKKRDEGKRAADADTFEKVTEQLDAGRKLTPEGLS